MNAADIFLWRNKKVSGGVHGAATLSCIFSLIHKGYNESETCASEMSHEIRWPCHHWQMQSKEARKKAIEEMSEDTNKAEEGQEGNGDGTKGEPSRSLGRLIIQTWLIQTYFFYLYFNFNECVWFFCLDT